MRLPATYKWIGLALLGAVIAVAVAIVASNLVSQQIGLASESISAGDALAPAVSSVGTHRSKAGNKGQRPTNATEDGEETVGTTPTTPSESTRTPTEPGDDSGEGSDD